MRRWTGEVPKTFAGQAEQFIADLEKEGRDMATRKSAQLALEKYAALLPELLGGSADLTGSNLTNWSGSIPVEPGKPFIGNYIRYGVREFGMTAMMNGIALHGGFIPYGGTFLVFADYARNGIRMAALMQQRVIFILTHDSIGVGEDGPTHQPVEHVASLRLIPGLSLWRPADAVEAAVAWQQAIEKSDGPTCLILSRQTLPHNRRNSEQTANIHRGAYVLSDDKGKPDAIIIATGSEVQVAMKAASLMAKKGYAVRVVSMVSVDLYEAQDKSYRDAVLPPDVTARVAVEAGSSAAWYKYVGSRGRVVGIDRFGKSAPANALFEYFEITAEKTAEIIAEVLSEAENATEKSASWPICRGQRSG
jgi:transketolase